MNITQMNIYEKLQNMRVELQEMKIKKSGKNNFANYEYYELGDILPPINTIMARNKVCSIISFGTEAARLILVNAEQPDERIEFESPMAEASLKGTHPIQNLGAVETYQRRYLYMTAFEIVENDFFDATQGQEQEQTKQQPKARTQPAQKAPAQKAKEQTASCTLSDENGNKVNEAIKATVTATGGTAKMVIAAIEKAIHKPIKQLTDNEVDKVMKLLSDLINESQLQEV